MNADNHAKPGKLFSHLFLSIGAMKAGTTWLYAVLARHPALHFAMEKEIHYFYHRYVDQSQLNETRRLPEKGFLKAQRERSEQDPRVVFGFVGGPSQIKGWPVIRAAFAGVSRADFRVLVVDGSVDGSWWQGHDFFDLPGEWEVHSRYSQDDMDAFFAKIDVLLFMSQWKETFGLVIREALARGIQVIQTDSGGSTEHGLIAQDQLIPIGPDPAPLRHQISQAIEAHPAQQAPQKIADFASQAAELERLMSQVLADQETA